MGGGIMQLAIQGCQNIWLTSNPQITFWKAVYRRYANFALDTIDEPIIPINFGSKASVTISKTGDLLGRCYLKLNISGGTAPTGASWAWVRRLGHEIINTVELYIGGQLIDRHYGTWLNVWYDLTHDIAHDAGYQKMIGNIPELTEMQNSHSSATLYVPLKFFFCNYLNTPLPVVALSHAPIKIDFQIKPLEQLIVSSGFNTSAPGASMGIFIDSASVVTEVMYLEPAERHVFVKDANEILISSLQHYGNDAVTTNTQIINLAYHHVVKELIWVTRLGKYINTNGTNRYLAYHPTQIDTLRHNATKRFALALASYDAGGNLILSNNLLVPRSGLPSQLLARFNAISAAAVTTSPTIGNISILGELLTLEEVSTPTSELFTGVTRPDAGDGQGIYDVVVRMNDNYGKYIDGTGSLLKKGTLSFNGVERMKQEAAYYNLVQPLQHHTNVPQEGIYVYSFAVKPEEWQPSGVANFSSLDTAVLNLAFETGTAGDNTITSVYAVNYNLLKIMGGQAGLSFTL
jgi:hypothetical protein